MNHTLASAVLLLIIVLDPFGSLPIYISSMNAVVRGRRGFVAIRESAIAFLILLLFMLSGEKFLSIMHLTERSLAVSGGVILIIIAIRMVFGDPSGGLAESAQDKEPYIVPLAVPMLAGPSAMATVLLMASTERDNMSVWITALGIAISISCLVLFSATHIRRVVGDAAVEASQKLMGLVLAAIATEMILSGIKAYFISSNL
jgi:MarC family membrane protein